MKHLESSPSLRAEQVYILPNSADSLGGFLLAKWPAEQYGVASGIQQILLVFNYFGGGPA